MQEMSWDNGLAVQAQKHADRCLFAHSEDRVSTGENIWAAPFSNYEGAVRLWFDEVYDTQCGCQNYFKECCGHYTQVKMLIIQFQCVHHYIIFFITHDLPLLVFVILNCTLFLNCN